MSSRQSQPVPWDRQKSSSKSHTPIGVGLAELEPSREAGRLRPRVTVLYVVRYLRADGRDIKQRYFSRPADADAFAAKLTRYGKQPAVFMARLGDWHETSHRSSTAPEVPATLVPPGPGHRTHFLWVIRDCPYCHQRHTHGAGQSGTDGGHRVAHCSTADSSPGYFIVPESS